jgi:hypothetical protein
MFGRKFVLRWRAEIPNPKFQIQNNFQTPMPNDQKDPTI